MRTLPLLLIAVAFIPVPVFAQVAFSEIMYDLDGTDADREWLEVVNLSASSIDISDWKFREADTDHKLTLFQGGPTIPPQGFAIIAASPSVFLADNPTFSGIIFDSVFSLSNSGESLSLKDGALIEVDAVTYTSEAGGNGNGMSLQKIGTTWVARAPSPGFFQNQDNSGGGTNQETTATSTAATSTAQTGEEKQKTNQGAPAIMQRVFPDAGGNQVSIVGASVTFDGTALDDKNKSLLSGRYIWNFGDGETAEGKKVLHTYRFLGDYVVTLTVSDSVQSIIDTTTVSVIEPPLSISRFVEGESGYIEFVNASNHMLDLSWWRIMSSGVTFVIPDKTAILPAKALRFPNAITKIVAGSPTVSYPNGTEAFRYLSGGGAGVSSTPVQAMLPKSSPRPLSNSTAIEERAAPRREDVLAAVSEAQGAQEGFMWYGALGGLLVASVGALIFIRRSGRSKTGYEIIE